MCKINGVSSVFVVMAHGRGMGFHEDAFSSGLRMAMGLLGGGGKSPI